MIQRSGVQPTRFSSLTNSIIGLASYISGHTVTSQSGSSRRTDNPPPFTIRLATSEDKLKFSENIAQLFNPACARVSSSARDCILTALQNISGEERDNFICLLVHSLVQILFNPKNKLPKWSITYTCSIFERISNTADDISEKTLHKIVLLLTDLINHTGTDFCFYPCIRNCLSGIKRNTLFSSVKDSITNFEEGHAD